jgi:hypothetical protein
MGVRVGSSADVNAYLSQLLAAHGFDVQSEGSWVRFGPNRMRMNGDVYVRDARDHAASIQLDVRLQPWPGRLIVESFGGIGATLDDAVKDALSGFVRGSFHVLLSAFAGRRDDEEQVSRETWVLGGVPRDVTLGPAVVRGTPPDGLPLSRWIDQLRDALAARPPSEGAHWVRLYHAQADDRLLTNEVMLDNVADAELERRLLGFPWPPSATFFSVRCFLVLRGGRDVGRAVARMVERAALDDDALQDALATDDFSRTDAERLVAFAPLAFGRALLARFPVRLPDSAIIVDARGERREIRLAEEPFFAEAQELARDAYDRGTMTREEFAAIALRSAEVKALNDALTQGAKAEDMVFSPPVVTMRGFS